MEVIAITNQKGGVGKSTTANAIGAGLTRSGKKVLYIDLDPQCNLSYSLKATGKPLTAMEVLTGTATAQEAILATDQGDIIPASQMLATADLIINQTGKEYRLAEALDPIRSEYDYILIDTPPALGILTVNALTAADSVIIPAQADIYSLQGISQLEDTIRTVKKYCNQKLTIKGILITRYSARAVLNRDLSDLLKQKADQMETKLFNTKIRECIALKEAQATQADIFSYNSRSNAAMDYKALLEEMLNS